MTAPVGSDHDWEHIPPRNGSLAMRCTRCRTVWLCHERKPRKACAPIAQTPEQLAALFDASPGFRQR